MAGAWIDFDLHGHQIVAHYAPEECRAAQTNGVDGHEVPVRHFGLILDWDAWQELRDRLERAEADFIMRPTVRFEGLPGEQATMFVRDPAGNALEFKAFQEDRMVFEKQARGTD